MESRYANGVVVEHTSDIWNREAVEFYGDEGTIRVSRTYIDADPKHLLSVVLKPDDIGLPVSNHHQGNFLDCVRTRRETVAPIEVAHRSTSVCHLNHIAIVLGRKLRWDPARERFIDDPEADRLLSRPLRAPWSM